MLDPIRRNAQSWGVKLLFLAIIIVFVFWGVGSFTSGNKQVIAYVNETPITSSEYRQALEYTVDQYRQNGQSLNEALMAQMGIYQQVFNQLRNRILLQGKADELGIEATPAEVRVKIMDQKGFKNADGYFDPVLYKQVLAANGLTPAVFEEQIASQVRVEKLLDYLTLPAKDQFTQARMNFDFTQQNLNLEYIKFPFTDYYDQVEVTDDEVAARYEEQKDTYVAPPTITVGYLAFTPEDLAEPDKISDAEVAAYYEDNKNSYLLQERVKVSHIIIALTPDASEEAAAAAKSKIDDIKAQLDEGADFAELAAKYSEDSTGEKGGELGWLVRGRTEPAFEEAAFAAAPGSIVGPVKTSYGWHIIKVEEHEPEGVQPLADVADAIRSQMAQEAALERLPDLLDEALARQAAGESLEVIGQTLQVPYRATDAFTRELPPTDLQLTPEATELLFAMPVGPGNAQPVRLENGYILASKLAATDARPKALDEVKDEIAAELRAEKGEAMAVAEAQKVLAQLTDPATEEATEDKYKDQMQTSEYFTRMGGYMSGVADLDAFVAGIFSKDTPGWIPQPFVLNDYVAAIKITSINEPDQGTWGSMVRPWMQEYTKQRRAQLEGAVVQSLVAQAKMELVHPELMRQ